MAKSQKNEERHAGCVDGQKVVRLRSELDWSTKTLAKRAGYGPRRMQQIEAGCANVRPARLQKLAKALGVRSEELLIGWTAESGASESLSPPHHPHISSLPLGLGRLLGRRKELQALTDAWQDPRISVFYFEGMGGSGKTAIVRQWLEKFIPGNSGIRIYEFSFNGREQSGSGDTPTAFFEHARNYFNVRSLTPLTPYQLAERLAGAILQMPTVIVLDGVELLQYPPGHPRQGDFSDPAFRAFLGALVGGGLGKQQLTILTTRQSLNDLRASQGRSVIRKLLGGLDRTSTGKILDSYQITGRIQDVAAPIYRATRGHALTIHLLAAYIKYRFAGDGRRWREYWRLTVDCRGSIDATWVMQQYENWFAADPASLELLRTISLFEGMTTLSHLKSFLSGPPISQLTTAARRLQIKDLREVVNQLRATRLLLAARADTPDAIEMHLLVREYFRDSVRCHFGDGWLAGNKRLFELASRRLPKTKLKSRRHAMRAYLAIHYACRGQQYSAGLNDIYRTRIHPADGSDSVVRVHGLFGDDVHALFAFINPVTGEPVDALSSVDQRFVLEQVGTGLRWLGRLDECCNLMESVVERLPKGVDAAQSAVPLRYLAEARLLRGEFALSLTAAKKAVRESSGKDPWIDEVGARTIHAAILHHSGAIGAACRAFETAEDVQRQHEPNFESVLDSVRAFRYHSCLLDVGGQKEVLRRCMLLHGKVAAGHARSIGPVDPGILELTAGLAHLRGVIPLQPKSKMHLAQTKIHLNAAQELFLTSGRQEFIYHGQIGLALLAFCEGDEESAMEQLRAVSWEAKMDEMHLIAYECELLLIKMSVLRGETNAMQRLGKLRRKVDRLGLVRLKMLSRTTEVFPVLSRN